MAPPARFLRPRRPADTPRGRAAPPPARPARERLFRVAGLAAVSALFDHEPGRVERLFYEPGLKTEVAPFTTVLAAARRPFRMVDADELARVAGTVLHGGVVALMPPRPLPRFDPVAATGWAREGRPLLVLDGVGNPHNLGAIARTAAFFGLPRLLLSGHPGQALPSEAAYRVAEGGFEWLEVTVAPDLPAALRDLAGAGFRTVATALGRGRRAIGPDDLATGDGRPVALVLGNEEDGLPTATVAACGEVATIAGAGRIQSLNVAATAAILIHTLGHALGGAAGGVAHPQRPRDKSGLA